MELNEQLIKESLRKKGVADILDELLILKTTKHLL